MPGTFLRHWGLQKTLYNRVRKMLEGRQQRKTLRKINK